MNEFNVEEWERQQARAMRNIYSYNRPATTPIEGYSPKPTRASERRWTFVGIVLTGILLTLCGWVVWAAYDDIAHRRNPAQPVTVQEEKAPDVLGQIRTLEGMIAQAHQLKQETEQIHADLQKMLEKMEAFLKEHS